MSNSSFPFDIPTIDWCFDLELFYNTAVNSVDKLMNKKLINYKQFSYLINGVLTSILVCFGLMGSIMLLWQIRTSRMFSRRLAVHLGMICIWDALLLISCLVTYGIPVLLYSHTWYYGVMAYILYMLQPFASFCVLGTIWQVLVITLERYLAVTSPLKQRTRNAQFNVKWICFGIVLFSALLNLLPVPFERSIVPCFSIHNNTITYSSLLKQNDEDAFLGALLHLIPDIIFRAPIPILIIAFLTGKTIRMCNQRTVGTVIISPGSNKNIPLRLSLLSFKFIFCNTLYMFNSILIEILGIGQQMKSSETGEQSDEDTVRQYMNSFYLTDASNMLLVVHSATNWLLFYNWPKMKKGHRESVFHSTSFAHSYAKSAAMDEGMARYVYEAFLINRNCIGTEIVAKLCLDMPILCRVVVGMPSATSVNALMNVDSVRDLGEKVGEFIEQVLDWFSDTNASYSFMRELCRRLGYAHFESNVHFTAQQWKHIRSKVVQILTTNVLRNSTSKSYNRSELEDHLTKSFNFILSETRSGALCAFVEANQKPFRTFRSQSACAPQEWKTPHRMTAQSAREDGQEQRLLTQLSVS